jgi:hypothetical protein
MLLSIEELKLQLAKVDVLGYGAAQPLELPTPIKHK